MVLIRSMAPIFGEDRQRITMVLEIQISLKILRI